MSALSIGRPNAADLPLPVSALARMSRPSRAGGIAIVWMGVGSVNFRSRTARRSSGFKPRESKDMEMTDPS